MKNISTLIAILVCFTVSSFASNSNKVSSNLGNLTITSSNVESFKFNVTSDKVESTNANNSSERNDIIYRSNEIRNNNSKSNTPGLTFTYAKGV